VEGTVREVKRRVRVVASSYRAIDRIVTRWIVVTMVEWMEFGGKMGACSKDGVQQRLVILREETTDGWSRVTDEDERVAWVCLLAPELMRRIVKDRGKGRL